MGQPLFSPASSFWRINRELASGLAGPRAVLMQIAHPLIAAGVADHSQFRKNRLTRLYRTSAAAAVITFGSREAALRVIGRINRIHDRVHGELRGQAGRFPSGSWYDANDPELKLWVLSTITESTLLVYDQFVAPLSELDRKEYYRDSITVAKLFDIPDDLIPPSYSDFRRYMAAMLQSDAITVSDTARQIAHELFSASVMGTLLYAGSLPGIGLLPERLRNEFGFKWGERSERRFRVAAAASRKIRGFLPSVLCTSPVATLSQWRAHVTP